MSRKSSSSNSNPAVGIIGIQGAFGQSLAEYFRASGYCVIGSDKGTECANSDVARHADVVIIAVDIYAAEEVIREIAPLMRASQLLMDITSIKKIPCERMLESRASVIRLHPMWSPKNSWQNQLVVVCAVRPSNWLAWVEGFFVQHEVNITYMSPSEHDTCMAVVQGLPHTTTLMQADVLRRMGVDIPATRAAASPIYEIRFEMIGRLLDQDPELFAGILMLNDEVLAVVEAELHSLANLRDIIKQRDRARFARYFKENAAYLGDFIKESMTKTNMLLEFWKKN